ncbi:hypothetical protein [Janthinobacterium agaricidamnosum]|uniref:Uncharacterized protein n=1 Tax=Janthinobacterium agaricidamnosum NBRC 102515 = DSM 9628 TaxID=1349767 RepID=W0V445_9BURK|nr:hypothetical protein [Janthinobacterium agaricidamnosum]CDG82651.1 hypothetical protein GJA_2015 [Janthinobacterium agaricidamnosum NBRC 102515 = DSM 9628]
MNNTSNQEKNTTTQEVCIDLPGEDVRCWRSSDKIRVTLRKHRDIIFDIRFETGKIYTLQADESDFYNTREKKIVHARNREITTFKDGERFHLWITRSFKGSLRLKCEGKLIIKLTPSDMDKKQYDNDPKTKPQPIIIALGQSKNETTIKKSNEKINTPQPSSAQENCSIVCVVNGSLKEIPDEILEHFKKGGGKSGFVDIDPTEVTTRNWIWGQLAGTAAYAKDNWGWLRASLDERTHKGFQLVKARVHFVKGKIRFYFSGYSKYNEIFGPGGFKPGNDKIMNIFSGVGNTSSSFKAVTKGIAGTFKGNALVSFIFGSATSIAEWKDDLQKDGYDLTASLLMALLKAIIVAVLVAIIVACIIIIVMFLAATSMPIIVVGSITVVAGIIVNYAVESMDKKLGKMATGDQSNGDGLASVIAPFFRNIAQEIQGNWDTLMKKFPSDYKEITF